MKNKLGGAKITSGKWIKMLVILIFGISLILSFIVPDSTLFPEASTLSYSQKLVFTLFIVFFYTFWIHFFAAVVYMGYQFFMKLRK